MSTRSGAKGKKGPFMGHEIAVKKLGLNDTTAEGAYHVQVDGENIGINGRAFWESEAAAKLAGETHVLRVEAEKGQR